MLDNFFSVTKMLFNDVGETVEAIVENSIENELLNIVLSDDFNMYDYIDNLEMVDFCLKYGLVNVDDDEVCPLDGTMLIYASSKEERINLVKLLLHYSADVNRTDDLFTPLTKACCGNNYNTAKLLLMNGADVNKPDAFGNTPLIHACINNNLKLVELLLFNYGAEVDKPNNEKTTPLMVSIRGVVDRSIIQLLLSCGANVNATNENRLSPLAYAVEAIDISMIDELLKYKINKKTMKEATALAIKIGLKPLADMMADTYLNMKAKRMRSEGDEINVNH